MIPFTIGTHCFFRAQSTLPLVIRNFCEAMADRTGWAFTVLAGGPDMAKDGEIRSVGIHVGQDQYGNSFGKATPNFTDTILKPFSVFLHSVYGGFCCISKKKVNNDVASRVKERTCI